MTSYPNNLSLPVGWIEEFNDAGDPYYVDTLSNPPRSIWVHPYEDEQYLQQHPKDRGKLQPRMVRSRRSPSPSPSPPPYDRDSRYPSQDIKEPESATRGNYDDRDSLLTRTPGMNNRDSRESDRGGLFGLASQATGGAMASRRQRRSSGGGLITQLRRGLMGELGKHIQGSPAPGEPSGRGIRGAISGAMSPERGSANTMAPMARACASAPPMVMDRRAMRRQGSFERKMDREQEKNDRKMQREQEKMEKRFGSRFYAPPTTSRPDYYPGPSQYAYGPPPTAYAPPTASRPEYYPGPSQYAYGPPPNAYAYDPRMQQDRYYGERRDPLVDAIETEVVLDAIF